MYSVITRLELGHEHNVNTQRPTTLCWGPLCPPPHRRCRPSPPPPPPQCQYSAAHYSVLDSNAVSVFVVILVEFDKYKYTIRSKSKYQTMSILSGPVLCAGVTFYSADKTFHLLVDRFSTQKVDIFHLPSTFSALFTVSRRNHENERKTSNACKDVNMMLR